MKIYVVMEHDTDSSRPHSAYIEEEDVKQAVEKLNNEEQAKAEFYNEWITNDIILVNSEGEEYFPEWGDNTYTYRELELYGDIEM